MSNIRRRYLRKSAHLARWRQERALPYLERLDALMALAEKYITSEQGQKVCVAIQFQDEGMLEGYITGPYLDWLQYRDKLWSPSEVADPPWNAIERVRQERSTQAARFRVAVLQSHVPLV